MHSCTIAIKRMPLQPSKTFLEIIDHFDFFEILLVENSGPKWITSFHDMIFILSSYYKRNSNFRWSITPKSIPVRVVFYTILLCGCIVFWHWKAGIISNLSIQKYAPPFDDLSSFLATDYMASLLKGSSYQNIFDDDENKDSLWYQVWQKKMVANQERSLVKNKQEGVNQLLNDPKMAYFDNLVSVKSFHEYSSCEIRAIPKDFTTARYAIFCFKHRFL